MVGCSGPEGPPHDGRGDGGARGGVGERVELALSAGYAALRQAGVESPRRLALLALAAAAERDTTGLLAHPEAPLAPGVQARYAALLGRLAAREPLAYVLGEREFYGRAFGVTPAVLVPRPETELLVAVALEYLQPRVVRLAVDVGTGSGALAVTLAVERTSLRVLALDCSRAALAVARTNAERHDVSARVPLACADLLAPLRGPLELVVANLPYIPASLIDSLMPEVAGYEPRVALDGGADGLALIARLLAELASRLAPGGLAVLEFGADQAEAVSALAARALPAADRAVLRDLAGLPRALRVQQA